MGCDIHIYFETRDENGKWAPTFGASPAEDWYEQIADDKLESGAAALAIPDFTQMNSRHQSEAVTAYFKDIPLDEAQRRYGSDPRFRWDYHVPHESDYTRGVNRISDRNYEFFGAVAKVRYRNYPNAYEPRGIPEDISPQVLHEVTRYDSDGHTHSWLGVQEMLDAEVLKPFNDWQLRYLREHIPDPANTRMVFFFDN